VLVLGVCDRVGRGAGLTRTGLPRVRVCSVRRADLIGLGHVGVAGLGLEIDWRAARPRVNCTNPASRQRQWHAVAVKTSSSSRQHAHSAV